MEEVQAERDFTITESFDRNRLLNEAKDIILYGDLHLGPDPKPHSPTGTKHQFFQQLQKLEEEQALFSPRLDVRSITRKDFSARKLKPPHELITRMNDDSFHFVNIPITLFPRSGWAFTRLECWIEFCGGEADSHLRPLVYEMFPDDSWSEILSFNDHLSLGLDEHLTFRAEVDKKIELEKLSGEANAKVITQVGAGVNLLLGPFSYTVRRSDVRGRGRLNAQCFWRLDSKKRVDEEDVILSVIIMVPKSRRQPVNAVGKLKAYHSFQLWTADIFKDYWKDFGDKLKSFFKAGLVVEAATRWENITNM